MSITLKPAAPADYKLIRQLYKSAFPAEERAPFFMLKNRTADGRAQMLAARDADGFVGFAYLVYHLDLAYLSFFAIAPERRGTGCGSEILGELKERLKGKRLFLAREQLDESSDNYSQRVKRHNFYLHNGFTDLSCKIREVNMVYDVMSFGGRVAPEEYDALVTHWCGGLIKKIFRMQAFE